MSVHATDAESGPSACPYPFGEANRLDLEPEYSDLRAHAPMARVEMPFGGQAWLATGYDAVRQVLLDPRFSRALAADPDSPRLSPEIPPASAIVSLDPPEHTRVRRLVARAFSMSAVEQQRLRVRSIVTDLLDGMDRSGAPADLVAEFALPLPLTVICEMLGVPLQDHDRFRRFTGALVTRSVAREEVADARADLEDYLWTLLERRRAEPTDDLLSALMLARVDSDGLADVEVINLAVGLLVGGHESTATHLTSSVFTLLQHPDELEALRRRPELIESAVEELLRFVPVGVAGGFVRVATENVQVGDVLVGAGEAVLPAMISANRDEAVFAAADRLDLERGRSPHLGFGHGAHHCIGSQLARMQLQEGIGGLIQRFPSLRLADAPLDWKTQLVQRGFASLSVAW